MYGLLFIIIIKLLIAFYKEMMSDDPPVIKQIIYEINGKPSDISVHHYYLQLLGLSNCKRIDHEVVSNAYYEKLSEVADRRLSGENFFFELEDFQAAKAYLNDTCNYMGAMN